MGKVHKPSDSEGYTPTSESFRINYICETKYLNKSIGVYVITAVVMKRIIF
jgi:hypothetical protein